MACQTCDHTMHNIADDTFWCPRCGTVKFQIGITEAPAAVKCFRRVLDDLPINRDWLDPAIERHGRECCWIPSERIPH